MRFWAHKLEGRVLPRAPALQLTSRNVANIDAVDAIVVFYTVDTVRLTAPCQLRADIRDARLAKVKVVREVHRV
jgi:hypothetical protein